MLKARLKAFLTVFASLLLISIVLLGFSSANMADFAVFLKLQLKVRIFLYSFTLGLLQHMVETFGSSVSVIGSGMDSILKRVGQYFMVFYLLQIRSPLSQIRKRHKMC